MRNILVVILLPFILLGCYQTDKTENKSTPYLSTSWSKAEVVSLCDSTDSQTASPELVSKHDGEMYYNKRLNKNQHEITVRFDFISECCREFEISYRIKDDVLIIEYKAKDGEVCECKCDYRGMVNIGDQKTDFTQIKKVSIKRIL